MSYDYRVDCIRAEIADKSIKDGTAGAKINAQVEVKLREWAEQGFEFYRSDVIPIHVQGQTGCLGNQVTPSYTINMLVFFFRRPLGR